MAYVSHLLSNMKAVDQVFSGAFTPWLHDATLDELHALSLRPAQTGRFYPTIQICTMTFTNHHQEKSDFMQTAYLSILSVCSPQDVYAAHCKKFASQLMTL